MIDCHTHVFPPKIGPKLAAAIGREFGREPAGNGLAEDLFEHLDRAGLARAVCFTAALRPDQMIPANSWMLSLKRSYPRLIPLGTVHPGHAAWETEMDRLERSGVRGLKIHPDLAGLPLPDACWDPVWEAARGRFVIMIHMGPARQGEPTVSRPADLAGILDRHPGLRVVAAHLGGLGQWEETLEHLAGKNLDMDTSCCHEAIPAQTLAELLKRHDLDRFLFGSDYPLFAPERELNGLRRALATAGVDVQRILKNGERLVRELQPVEFPDLAPSPGH